MTLSPGQLRPIIEQYLQILYPQVTNVEITFLVKDKALEFWKVNVRFKRSKGDLMSLVGLLAVDDNGDVTQFKEGWSWKY